MDLYRYLEVAERIELSSQEYKTRIIATILYHHNMKKWTKEETELACKYCKEGFSFIEIASKLERTSNSIKVRLNKLGIKSKEYKIFQTFICLECKSEVKTTFLGQIFCSHSCANKTIGSNRKKQTKQEKCLECNGPCNNKFCSSACQAKYRMMKSITNGTTSTITIKRFLISQKRSCSFCNLQIWCNNPIPLELDHIDGNPYNNTLLNLRLLCPNCHALTPTYKGKNAGNGRYKRKERYSSGKSF